MKRKCIDKNILERIRVVEEKVNVSHCPDLIMINYDTEHKKYVITETYMNHSGNGAKERRIEVDYLENYIFSPEFAGTCIMDLFSAPVSNPNLYYFQGEQLRKEEHIAKGKCFYIAIDEEYHNDSEIRLIGKEKHETDIATAL